MSRHTQLASQMASTYVMHQEMGNIDAAIKVERDVLEVYGMVSPEEWLQLLAEERHSRVLDMEAAERLMAGYKD